MTNPLSHKCENDSEPDQLIGDSDSKKHVNKYKQLILSVNLQIIVLSSSGNALFSFLFFLNDIYKCLKVASGKELFLQNNMGSKDTMVTY